MAAFSRDRFKAAKLDVNKKIADEVEKTFDYGSSKRGDYHEISQGINEFRMMPPHSEDSPSMQPKVVYWLECKVPDTDDKGQPTGKFSIKQRPIFDSRIHGGTEKDIIDEYIQFTKKIIFDSIKDKDERQKKLAPINGWRDSSKKWHPGILPSQSFVCYATKGAIIPANLGRLEMWKNDKDTLEKLNISEEKDEPIISDLFSDPDKGVQFVIKNGKDDKGNFYRIITKKAFTPPSGMKSHEYGTLYEEFLKSQVVPDNVLERLYEMTPLEEQFHNAYKKSDFEKAFEALQMFEEKYGYETFQNDEFLQIVAEIANYYPEEEKEAKTEEGTSGNDLLDLNGMTREELKGYIKEMNLPIRVVPSMSDDTIREMIVSVEAEIEEERNSCDTSSSPTQTEKTEEVPPVVEEAKAEEAAFPWEIKAKEDREKAEGEKVDPPSSAASTVQQLRDKLKRETGKK